MIRGLDYFYDGQQRRFLEQVVRAFSGFQYMTGSRAGEPPALEMVPCRMASTNRMVASIINNASENTLNTVPMITVWQTGLEPRFEDLQNQSHIGTLQVVEREKDDQGNYTGKRGQSYTVDRLMPVPFNMKVQVDIWTSTIDQKYQLEEQIAMQVCPSFEIQNSENALDWTALTVAYVESMDHSSRTIPVGTGEELDIMTFQFRIPIWLSPPAKVKQQNLINQVVTNINDQSELPGMINDPQVGQRLSQSVVTPGNHSVRVENGRITLLGKGGTEKDAAGQPWKWEDLILQYGALRPAASQIAVSTSNNIEELQIVGTVQIDQQRPNVLRWQIDPDTLPANTLAPVDAIIMPLTAFPGEKLPLAAEGQRYLVMEDLSPSSAWPGLTAKVGNIIQYQNGQWQVAYYGGSAQQFVLNVNTGSQLRWDGEDWVMAIDAEYAPGMWRLWL